MDAKRTNNGWHIINGADNPAPAAGEQIQNTITKDSPPARTSGFSAFVKSPESNVQTVQIAVFMKSQMK
jgi:hypothetical protein